MVPGPSRGFCLDLPDLFYESLDINYRLSVFFVFHFEDNKIMIALPCNYRFVIFNRVPWLAASFTTLAGGNVVGDLQPANSFGFKRNVLIFILFFGAANSFCVMVLSWFHGIWWSECRELVQRSFEMMKNSLRETDEIWMTNIFQREFHNGL